MSSALREAVNVQYVVYDRQGRVVARAQVGQSVQIPEGTYTLVVRSEQPVTVSAVRVGAGQPARFILRRTTTGWTLAPEGRP